MTAQPTERQIKYREVYLRSDHWRQMRQLALEDAECRCAVCNASKNLDVHHRTYERLGNERLTDLLVLCRKCHDIFHGNSQLAGQQHRKKSKSKKRKNAGYTKPHKKREPITSRMLPAVNAPILEAAALPAPRPKPPEREHFVPRHIRERRDWREERQLPRRQSKPS